MFVAEEVSRNCESVGSPWKQLGAWKQLGGLLHLNPPMSFAWGRYKVWPPNFLRVKFVQNATTNFSMCQSLSKFDRSVFMSVGLRKFMQIYFSLVFLIHGQWAFNTMLSRDAFRVSTHTHLSSQWQYVAVCDSLWQIVDHKYLVFKAVCGSLWQSMISAVLHASLMPF